MKSYYLRENDEAASTVVLNRIGVSIVTDIGSTSYGMKEKPTALKLTECCTSDSQERVTVDIDGTFVCDVRDTAGEWVRMEMCKGDCIELNPGVQHRMSVGLAPGSRKTQLCSSDTADAPDVDLSGAATTRQLLCELCAHFYSLGWVTGTGGSICIRYGERIYIAPSGVQKERILPEEVFVIDRLGEALYTPPTRKLTEATAVAVAAGTVVPRVAPRISQCGPLFLNCFSIRGAGAVIHTHAVCCVMITLLFKDEFRITHQEMIKAIEGHGFHDELVVPIIENTAHERDLADSLAQAIVKYPRSNAVLVRRHGVYVWGKTWEQAKTQAESYHYLFEVAVEMMKMPPHCNVVHPSFVPTCYKSAISSASASTSASASASTSTSSGSAFEQATQGCTVEVEGGEGGGGEKRKMELETEGGGGVMKRSKGKQEKVQARARVVLLDIEGTTTSIAFVKEQLFPFARSRLHDHLTRRLRKSFPAPADPIVAAAAPKAEVEAEAEAEEDVRALKKQADEDTAAGLNTPVIPCLDTSPRSAVLACCEQYAKVAIDADRKLTALKQLQGHIWREGYASGELQGQVYPDVRPAIEAWVKKGVSVGIYSSGSVEAQKLIFSHSTAGDMLPLLSCHFDTKTGHKRVRSSYEAIVAALQQQQQGPALKATDVLFVTDVWEEAEAAVAAGMQVVLSIRPGNAPLPAKAASLPSITSFDQLEVLPALP